MDRLPAELVAQICSQLCLHCTAPDALPHADTAEAVATKTSLARFSRTCKRMHAIAQPYVYHYFATGNMPKLVASKQTGCATGVALPQGDNDHLPLFLRTIIQYPDLAVQVKALQLVTSTSTTINDLSEPDLGVIKGGIHDASATTAAFQMIQQASIQLGEATRDMFHPDLYHTNVGPFGIHRVLEQLAMLLCPNASTIVLGFSMLYSGFRYPILSSTQGLTSLRTLGLVSHDKFQELNFVGSILECTPNVETLHVAHIPDPKVWEDPDDFPVDAFPDLVKGRRLVASDIDLSLLAALVRSCQQLDTLEYRHHGYFRTRNQVPNDEIVQALRPAQKTLRRLLLVTMVENDPRGNVLLSPAPPLDSLRGFERLEELAINQDQIGEDPGTWADLAELLPRSIKRVEFLYVWFDFTAPLEALARDAPAHLPNLRSVCLRYLPVRDEDDEGYDPDDWFPCKAGEHERLRELFAAVSITLSWDRMSYKMPRGESTAQGTAWLELSQEYVSTPYCFWES